MLCVCLTIWHLLLNIIVKKNRKAPKNKNSGESH